MWRRLKSPYPLCLMCFCRLFGGLKKTPGLVDFFLFGVKWNWPHTVTQALRLQSAPAGFCSSSLHSVPLHLDEGKFCSNRSPSAKMHSLFHTALWWLLPHSHSSRIHESPEFRSVQLISNRQVYCFKSISLNLTSTWKAVRNIFYLHIYIYIPLSKIAYTVYTAYIHS